MNGQCRRLGETLMQWWPPTNSVTLRNSESEVTKQDGPQSSLEWLFLNAPMEASPPVVTMARHLELTLPSTFCLTFHGAWKMVHRGV